MTYLQWIISIGGAMGALVAIWRAVVFFVHLGDAMKDTQRHTKENYLSCLRLTIMSRDMPIGERIIAGHAYIEAGGNGEVKKYIEEQLHAKEVQKDGRRDEQ